TLCEYLDDFCTAYLDDVFIYTNSSLQQHREQVDKVLTRLKEARLYVNIKKCEFEVVRDRSRKIGFDKIQAIELSTL
ncbi:hypothetical protein PtrM4_102850, partial [Pyrenophora tritici-repentis]